MANYVFDVPHTSNELPGWQDVLTCPFCLGIAVECLRLPHAEPDRDCGVCACTGCVREWVVFSNHADLACPRCRYPICAVHLDEMCRRPNPRDPFIARLVADVVAQCPYCDMKGTVSTVMSHTAGQCVKRHLAILHTTDAGPQEGDGTRWVDTVVALHALADTESCHYLVQWICSHDGAWAGTTTNAPIRSLFIRVPMHVLDVYETVWRSGAVPFSMATIVHMYDVLMENQSIMAEDHHATTGTRLMNRMVDGFTSDDPVVLSDMLNNLGLSSSIMQAIPSSVLQAFVERLCTMVDPPPTHTHAKLLTRCLEANRSVDEKDAKEWLSRILKLPNIDCWWSNELVVHCMFQSLVMGPFNQMMGPFCDLCRLRHREQRMKVDCPLHALLASLLYNSLDLGDPRMPPYIFCALSMLHPFLLESSWPPSWCSPALCWTMFVQYTVNSETDPGHDCVPFVMTPRVVQALGPLEPNNHHTVLRNHMNAVLTTPQEFLESHRTMRAKMEGMLLPWTASWLGYFTLSIAMFSDIDEWEWDDVPDTLAEQILTSATHNPGWWKTHHVDWTWARVIVRLLAVFVRPDNDVFCRAAACALAEHLGTTVDAPSITNRNWTTKVPIFPRLHDLSRFLSLLADEILLRSDILPVFVMSHTGAIMDRLCVVASTNWTVGATTCVVQHGATKTVPTVAWAAWFRLKVPWHAQRAAVETADIVLSPGRILWVLLLRIHAMIPTHCAPPRRADALARLLSNEASPADVEHLLEEWVSHPAARVRALVDRWARAAHSTYAPSVFALSRLHFFCKQYVSAASPSPTICMTKGFTGPCLVELASTEMTLDSYIPLWFVVHYAADDVLIATAAQWVAHLRHRLLTTCAMTSYEYIINDTCRWYLENRCGLLCPPVPVVDCLCLGLHMVTKYDIQPERMVVSNSEKTMQRLVGALGDGDDACYFLFIQTTTLRRWHAWAALVACNAPAWRKFVQDTPEGHTAVQSVLETFPVMPIANPEKQAWCETCAATSIWTLASSHL